MLRGNLAFVNQSWDEAAESFERARTLRGPEQDLAFNRALALVQAGRIGEAIGELRTAETGEAGIAARARALREQLEKTVAGQ